MGEATIGLADSQRDLGVLAIDVHTPGIGRLLNEIARLELTNVRVFEGNGLALLENRIADADLDGLRLFFPDPWPKARHHKRRFVTAEHMSLVAQKVRTGGFFHFATDWQDYADQAHAVLAAHPQWTLLRAGEGVEYAQPHDRPRTRFEQRGIDAGREITDLVAVRR
jgi:tRNA (guanine-N7-)-methyltransferase